MSWLMQCAPLEEMQGYVIILFVITFATIYQCQIWGGFAIILQVMCKYYLFHPPI